MLGLLGWPKGVEEARLALTEEFLVDDGFHGGFRQFQRIGRSPPLSGHTVGGATISVSLVELGWLLSATRAQEHNREYSRWARVLCRERENARTFESDAGTVKSGGLVRSGRSAGASKDWNKKAHHWRGGVVGVF